MHNYYHDEFINANINNENRVHKHELMLRKMCCVVNEKCLKCHITYDMICSPCEVAKKKFANDIPVSSNPHARSSLCVSTVGDSVRSDNDICAPRRPPPRWRKPNECDECAKATKLGRPGACRCRCPLRVAGVVVGRMRTEVLTTA